MESIKGINPVIELLNTDTHIEKLEIYKNINKNTIIKLLTLASKKNIKVFYTDKRYENSQGVVAYITSYNYYKSLDQILENVLVKDDSTILILDQIQDPRNFGAIIRTAECFGIDAVIIQNRNNVKVTETVVKTSTGAIEHVNICEVTNISDTIEKLKKYGYVTYAAEANAKNYYKDFNYKGKVCLVVGSEGKGIRQKVRQSCDYTINIHLKGVINSLNVSVATGILLSEMTSKK